MSRGCDRTDPCRRALCASTTTPRRCRCRSDKPRGRSFRTGAAMEIVGPPAFEDLEHVAAGDFRDGAVAEARKDVSFQARRPGGARASGCASRLVSVRGPARRPARTSGCVALGASRRTDHRRRARACGWRRRGRAPPSATPAGSCRARTSHRRLRITSRWIQRLLPVGWTSR